MSTPALTIANAALDAVGYHRTTPRAEIRPEHWHLIEALDKARDAELDAEDEKRRTENQIRRANAAGLALKLLRQKLERCAPEHTAALQAQIAAILAAHPTLS